MESTSSKAPHLATVQYVTCCCVGQAHHWILAMCPSPKHLPAVAFLFPLQSTLPALSAPAITSPGRTNGGIPQGQKCCFARAVVPHLVPCRKRPLGAPPRPGSLCSGSVEPLALPSTSAAPPLPLQGLAPVSLLFLPQFPK